MDSLNEIPIGAGVVRRQSFTVTLSLAQVTAAQKAPIYLPTWPGPGGRVVQVFVHTTASMFRTPTGEVNGTAADYDAYTLTLADANDDAFIRDMPLLALQQWNAAGGIVPRPLYFDRLEVALERCYVQNNGVKLTPIVLEFIYE